VKRFWEGNKPSEDWTEADGIAESEERIYPIPSSKKIEDLEEEAQITSWQYFPFSPTKNKNGPVSPKEKTQGKSKIDPYLRQVTPP
jgi:hypothetical protein